jgi:1-acyl-sn-glycerol-3-phosphate acyltransferase
MVKRRVTFLAKAEYFTTPGVKGRLSRLFFAGVGQVPIDRDDTDAAKGALTAGVRILRRGDLLGIYPEGTRSPDGRLYKGKTGLARMVLQARVPVVPVAMYGTDKANPIGSKMWRPYPIRIKIGAPLDFSRYDGLAGDRFVERSITDEIMYALMELSGQEYVDVYAAKVKEDMDRAAHARADGAAQEVLPRQPAAVETDRVQTKAG